MSYFPEEQRDRLLLERTATSAGELGLLTPNELTVIKYRLPFADSQFEPLQRVGRRIGTTRERVRQLEAKAVRSLHSYLEDPERYSSFVYSILPMHIANRLYSRGIRSFSDLEKIGLTGDGLLKIEGIGPSLARHMAKRLYELGYTPDEIQVRDKREGQTQRRQMLAEALARYGIEDKFSTSELATQTGITIYVVRNFLEQHGKEWGVRRFKRGVWTKFRAAGERIPMSQYAQAENQVLEPVL